MESVERLDDSMEGKQRKEEGRAFIPEASPYRQEHSVDVRFAGGCGHFGEISHHAARPVKGTHIAWLLGISRS